MQSISTLSSSPNNTDIKIDSLIITSLQNKKLIETASALPPHGILKVYDQHFIYLDIDDRFINNLFPLILEKQVEKPDYFSNGIGAHISVIYPNEKMNAIYQANQFFQFEIDQLFTAETYKAIYFVLTVKAPDLLKIREINNLSEKLNLNGLIIDLHITIGKISKNEQEKYRT